MVADLSICCRKDPVVQIRMIQLQMGSELLGGKGEVLGIHIAAATFAEANELS